jgi:hypothetical protein
MVELVAQFTGLEMSDLQTLLALFKSSLGLSEKRA